MDGWTLKVFNEQCGLWQVFGVGTRGECEEQAGSIGKTIERTDDRRRVFYAD
ncbi:hypothetical protein PQR05_29450 [Paraburkholderia sediminicola]|uniref:hypothetical protein n=1 Tax=Paraburkholderia sediminicola TaxID=458836 RepID=UPI0038BD21A0